MTENNAAQAIQEGERNSAADQYFKARAWVMDTNDNRRIFEAGFDRAYALLSKLRAEGVQAGDERAHHRNEGFSSLCLWWTMIEAEAELIGEPIKDDRPILSFMGSGASHQVTAGDIRAALASAPVADDVAEVHSLTGETGYTGVAPAAPIAEQQQWRIRVVGPAGYERFESFNGSSLDDACLAAQVQGFVCCQDEDGHVIVEDSPARTVQVQNSAPVAGEAISDKRLWLMMAPWHLQMLRAHELRDVTEFGRAAYAAGMADAAPQASEAVRNARADGFIAGFICAGGDAEEATKQAPQLQACIDACQPQADKDGGDCAKGAGKWPMLSELHLHALMFAYNEGYSKAYDGRVFPNPFSENGSQAAAWQLGTDDGTEARAAQHPRTDGGGRG